MTESSSHHRGADGSRSGGPGRSAQPNPLDHDGPIAPGTPVPGMPSGAGRPPAGRAGSAPAPTVNPLDHDGPVDPATPVPGATGHALPGPGAGHEAGGHSVLHRLHLPWGEHEQTAEERQREREEAEAAEDRLLMYSSIVGVLVLVGLVLLVVLGDYA